MRRRTAPRRSILYCARARTSLPSVRAQCFVPACDVVRVRALRVEWATRRDCSCRARTLREHTYRLEARLSQTHRSSQPGTASANDDGIVRVVHCRHTHTQGHSRRHGHRETQHRIKDTPTRTMGWQRERERRGGRGGAAPHEPPPKKTMRRRGRCDAGPQHQFGVVDDPRNVQKRIQREGTKNRREGVGEPWRPCGAGKERRGEQPR